VDKQSVLTETGLILYTDNNGKAVCLLHNGHFAGIVGYTMVVKTPYPKYPNIIMAYLNGYDGICCGSFQLAGNHDG
jgi:hypothetical protein